MRAFVTWLVVLFMASTAAHAFDAAAVPAPKRTKLGQYLSSQEAAKFMEQNASKALFLDVRTTAEVTFLGMPMQADANVPYMKEPDFPVWDSVKGTFKLELNPDFLPEVRRRLAAKGLGPDDTDRLDLPFGRPQCCCREPSGRSRIQERLFGGRWI